MYTYDYYIKQFQDAKLFLKNRVEQLDDELFLMKPKPSKWCIGEIIDHLNITGSIYLPAMQKKLEIVKDEYKFGGEPFKLGFLMGRFKHYVSPEFEKKLPTVPNLKPSRAEDLNRSKIEETFNKLQDDFITLLNKAQVEQVALDHVKMRNPEVKLIKMDVNAAFAIMEAHQRRHFEQIKDIISISV